MSRFYLTVEASATYSSAAPTLNIWLNGVQVDSAVVTAQTGSGSNTFTFLLDNTSGLFPTLLSLQFSDGSGEPGRTVEIEDVRVNGQSVDVLSLSQTTLVQNQSALLNTTLESHLFGRDEPTALDLGDVTLGGTVGADDLSGSSGIDVIDGSNGADRIRGLGDDDAINGGVGDDMIFGEGGNDVVIGGTGNDIIFGNDGDDLLFGQAGIDTLIGGDGNDVLNGGANDDFLIGDDGDDILFGEDGNDVLVGMDGDDTLYGDNGDDMLAGGAGDDLMLGGNNNDTILGEDGNDTILGESGNDFIRGDAGDDAIDGGSGDDTLWGGTGADTIYGGADDDKVYGDEGDDTLYGNDGDDIVVGGTGADTLDGGNNNDVLHGNGINSDTISQLLDANPNIVYNEDTNSFYQYVNTNVTIDAAKAAAAAATLNGLAGHLVNVTSAAENTFIANLITAETWLGAEDSAVEGDWVWTNGPEAGALFWVGVSGGTLQTGFYQNWSGGEPNDYGTGEDFVEIRTDGLWNDNGGPNQAGLTRHYVIEWEAGAMSDDNAADTLNGGAGNDTLYGYGGDDILNGGTGNDLMFGGAGNDTLDGGTGTDNMYGGAGDDTYYVDSAADTVTEFASSGTDTVYSSVDFVLDDNTENLTLTGTGGIDGTGNSGANTIIGNSGNNIIVTNGGGDTVWAGAGHDNITGGVGDVAIYGEDGNDTITSGSIASSQWIQDILDANAGVTYSSETGNFYQVISSMVDWDVARAGAASMTINGVSGHLATVTSQEEHDYIVGEVGGVSTWLGGSDAPSVTGGSYNQWFWVEGPEAGTQFSNGGTATGGQYTNWDSTQPNDSNNTQNYLYLLDSSDQWADMVIEGDGTGGFVTVPQYIVEWEGDDLAPASTAIGTLIDGGAGNDVIYGGSAIDTLIGGAGNDTIYSGSIAGSSGGGPGGGSFVVSTEDFESGASGWNNNTTEYGGSTMTTVLGRHSNGNGTQQLYKTYALSGNEDSVTIQFDFYEIDSWDGEQFNIFVNDAQVYSRAFTHDTYDQPADGSSGIVSWTVEELTPDYSHVGFSSGTWGNDQMYRYTLTIDTQGSSVKLGFGNTLNQAVADEAMGIDNIVVTEVYTSGGGQLVTLISEDFSSGTGVFTYGEPLFGGNGTYASGTRTTTDGYNANGALQVYLGSGSGGTFTNIDGGWETTLNLTQDTTGVELSFAYRMILSRETDNNEDVTFYVELNGTKIGVTPNNYVTQLEGVNGNGGSDHDTGWTTVTLSLGDLSAGTYDLELGALMSQRSSSDEDAYLRLDDLTLTGTQAVTTILSENFSSGSGAFTYGEPLFGGSGAYASGSHITTDGYGANGAIEVYLGSGSGGTITNLDGGWETSLNLTEEMTNVEVSFAYRMLLANDTEAGEDLTFYVELDGTKIGVAPNNYVDQIQGSGGGAGGDHDTGWVTVTLALGDLSAGTYDLELGAFLNQRTEAAEDAFLRIDDVTVTGTGSGGGGGSGSGANAATILNGGDGLDNLYGNDGADIFVFEAGTAFNNIDQVHNFDTSQGDALDISDILAGYYDPMTDAITDFVRITGGGSSDVRVDITGSGSFGAGTRIASIVGVGGLTDEAQLEADGFLITS